MVDFSALMVSLGFFSNPSIIVHRCYSERVPENEQTTSIGYAAIVDVETTGFNHASDEVVELGLLLFSFDRATGSPVEIVAEYDGLRDPGRPIPPDATRQHGLHWEDVVGHALDQGQVRGILSRAELIIAHNAKFDRGFVVRLFPEAACIRWACSMDGIGWYRKGFPSKGLQQLLARHQIKVDVAHRALADARNTLALLSVVQGTGVTYLAELLQRC